MTPGRIALARPMLRVACIDGGLRTSPESQPSRATQNAGRPDFHALPPALLPLSGSRTPGTCRQWPEVPRPGCGIGALDTWETPEARALAQAGRDRPGFWTAANSGHWKRTVRRSGLGDTAGRAGAPPRQRPEARLDLHRAAARPCKLVGDDGIEPPTSPV